jgi:hypothetical protein
VYLPGSSDLSRPLVQRCAMGIALLAVVASAGCTAESEPATEVGISEGDLAATLRAKVTWNKDERGYWRWELSESPSFASGVLQTTRRDFGPMAGSGGPATIAERVRSSSCAGLDDACSVLPELKPSTRYYVRFCGELSAPSASGYRCFDSNPDSQDPPYEYDSFVTPVRETLLTSAPDVTSQGAGRLMVFVRGTDDELLQISHNYQTGSWSGWHRPATGLGNESMTSAPGAAWFRPNRNFDAGFDVIARGANNLLYHSVISPTVADPLYQLEGYVTSGPDAARRGGLLRLDIVACGPTNELQHMIHSDYGDPWWSDWQLVGGSCTADPSVVASGGARLDVFTRGTDGAVYQRTGTAADSPPFAQWGSWLRIDGLVTSGVDATSSAAGRVDLFARGPSNELLHNIQQSGTWSGWQSLGGDLTSDPTAISAEAGRIDVFARCAEDALHHWSFSQGVWRRTDLGDCSTNVFEPEGPDEILDDDPDDPELDPDDFVTGASLAASQPLTLADQRETQAVEILESDNRTQKLLANTDYSIDKIGPWTEPAADGTQRLVGATMILDLPQARDWPMTAWPVIGYLPKRETYLQSTDTFAIAGAKEVLVDIDMTKGRVVGISPLGGIVTKRPPGERSKPSARRGD